jgi:L-lactate dehydrogenase complex protein LldF
MSQYEIFLDTAEETSFDIHNQEKKQQEKYFFLSQYNEAKPFYKNLNLAKKRLEAIKSKVIENLDKYLIEFESEYNKVNGGRPRWANEDTDVHKILVKLAHQLKINVAYVQEGNLTKELRIEYGLNKEKVTIFGQGPYKLFVANALTTISSTGQSVVVCKNETEQSYLMQADTVVVLCGINEIIPTLEDSELLMHLYSMHKANGFVNEFINYYSPSQKDFSQKNNKKYILVMVDNGRARMMSNIVLRKALTCINCNACLHLSALHNTVGTRAFDTTYSGAIGTILQPHLQNIEDFTHLTFANMPNNTMADYCPVNIDFDKLYSTNKQLYVKEGKMSKKENLALYFWKTAMLKRSKMEKGGTTLKNLVLRQFFKKGWGTRKDFPEVVEKSFNQLYREKQGIEVK